MSRPQLSVQYLTLYGSTPIKPSRVCERVCERLRVIVRYLRYCEECFRFYVSKLVCHVNADAGAAVARPYAVYTRSSGRPDRYYGSFKR